jgi:hypothetical protein
MSDDREYGHYLLENIDLDAQLLAIRAMLARNRAADHELSKEIEELDAKARQAKGDWGRHLVDLTVDELHGSVYQSAATSAAAVGALAPLLETFFHEVFTSLRKHFEAELQEGLDKVRPVQEGFDPWDHYWVLRSDGPKQDVASGILQLTKAVGLSPRLPADHASLIEALFSYRNRMLHRGFEWPMEERKRFLQLASEKRWPKSWFDQATSGGEPWVIYITDEFIDRCLTFIDELLAAAGAYNRELINLRPVATAEEYAEILAQLADINPDETI